MRWPSEPSPDVNHTQILASEQIGFGTEVVDNYSQPPFKLIFHEIGRKTRIRR